MENKIEQKGEFYATLESGEVVKNFEEYNMTLYDVAEAYPGVKVPGIEAYTNRAMVLPVEKVIMPETDKSKMYSEKMIDFYKKNNIGPKEFISLKMNEDETMLDKVFQEIKNMDDLDDIGRILLFAQSSSTQEKIIELAKRIGDSDKYLIQNVREIKSRLGLPTLRSSDVGSSWEENNGKILGALPNDEIALRPLLEKKGFGKFNMDYLVLDNECLSGDECKERINELISERGAAFIKFSGGASGASIKKVKNFEEVKNFIKENPNGYKYVLTEDITEILKENKTAQFYIDKDGDISFEGFTKQLVDEETGTIHQGNVMSTVKNDPINKIDKKDFNDLTSAIGSITKDMKNTHIGIDLFDTIEGPKIIEINGRMTGAIQPVVLMDQVRMKTGIEELYTFSMNTFKPGVEIDDFDKLTELIGHLMYDENDFIDGEIDAGVIPTLVDTLPEKMGMIIIGKSKDAVRSLSEKLLEKLEIDDNINL